MSPAKQAITLGLPALLLALPPMTLAGNRMICCEASGSGRTVCMDSMPPQCVGHAWRELDARGNVVKRVDAPIPAELREAEARRRKDEETAKREQRRKDQALLDTYTNEKDIDLLQSRWERDTLDALTRAEASLEEARKQQKRYLDEAERYKNKAQPDELNRSLTSVAGEIKYQTEIIATRKRELASIRAKFDDERRRYRELTGKISTPTGSTAAEQGGPQR